MEAAAECLFATTAEAVMATLRLLSAKTYCRPINYVQSVDDSGRRDQGRVPVTRKDDPDTEGGGLTRKVGPLAGRGPSLLKAAAGHAGSCDQLAAPRLRPLRAWQPPKRTRPPLPGSRGGCPGGLLRIAAQSQHAPPVRSKTASEVRPGRAAAPPARRHTE